MLAKVTLRLLTSGTPHPNFSVLRKPATTESAFPLKKKKKSTKPELDI